MENEFNLGASSLIEIGATVGELLVKNGIKDKATLEIKVSDEDFKKTDEDLFYRNGGKAEDYVPSIGKLIVNFKNLKINVVSIGKEN